MIEARSVRGWRLLWPATRRLGGLLLQAIDKYGHDDGPWLAAAMAYYAAFSMFPIVLVFISGIGLLLRLSPGAQDAQGQLLAVIARNGSPTLAMLVGRLLVGVKTDTAIGGPIGIIVLLVGAAGFFVALDAAFDRLWNVPARSATGIVATARRLARQRLLAFVMLMLLGLLIVLSLLGGLLLSAIASLANQTAVTRLGWQVVQVGVSVAVDSAVFAVIYRVLPKARVHWRDACTGALLAAVVWEIGKYVLAWVVIGQHYDAYGVVGAFIALMAWIYYASMIFFIGAEYTQVLCQARNDTSSTHAYRRRQSLERKGEQE